MPRPVRPLQPSRQSRPFLSLCLGLALAAVTALAADAEAAEATPAATAAATGPGGTALPAAMGSARDASAKAKARAAKASRKATGDTSSDKSTTGKPAAAGNTTAPGSTGRDAPAAAASAAAADDDRRGYRITPLPSWVASYAPDPGVTVPKSPVDYDVLDEQTRVDADSEERYSHYVRVVRESAGLELASQLQVEFDPSYQQVLLHRLLIRRGDQRIDKLAAAQVRLLHRETELERQVYDGRLTATIVLDDLRAGDAIEFAYTVRGRNPVFGGKFVDNPFMLSRRGPVRLYIYRLLAPAGRVIHHQAPQDVQVSEGDGPDGLHETVFRRTSVEAMNLQEPSTPPEYFLRSMLQLSEFSDWAEVARWSAGLFAPAAAADVRARARADAIRAEGATPAAQVEKVLDVVQSEVRYFGTELGVNSHQPAAPDQVLAQRFGDCKDKVALLVSMLRELGVESTPVLVSNAYREHVADLLPSPLAFDHVIARTTLDGQPLWLDGTRSLQHGPPSARSAGGFGFGLPASADAGALAEVPGTGSIVHEEVTETLHFAKLSEDPELEVRMLFRGELAEAMRSVLDGKGSADFERGLAGDYARYLPGIQSLEPMRTENADDDNAFILHLHYRVPDYFHFNEQHGLTGTVALGHLAEVIRLPGFGQRATDYMGWRPGRYLESFALQFEEDVAARDGETRFDDSNAAAALHLRNLVEKRRFVLDGEVAIQAPVIAAGDWTGYVESVRKQLNRLVSSVSIGSVPATRVDDIRKQLLALDAKVRKGSGSEDAKRMQTEFGVKLVMLSAQLDAGRLTPALRKTALNERGQALDLLDRPAEAQKDFDEALRLDPADARTLGGAAVNAVMRADDARAVELAGLALARGKDNAVLKTRVFANYWLHQFDPARDDLNTLLADGQERDRSYSGIWLYLVSRRLGEDGTAAARAHLPVASHPDWPYPVLRFLVGDLSFDDALRAASRDGKPDGGRLCELYYYAGEKALLDGDTPAATRLFRQSLDTGITGFDEYTFARRELAALGRK